MNTRSYLTFLLSLAAAHAAFSQGDLAPPGAPAPTMKTLDQLDTRLGETNTKLDAASAKVDDINAKTEKRIPISSLPFNINTPGSYYVTANLEGTAGQNGINVSVSHVTIDLNGFRVAGPGLSGIVLGPSSSSCAVRNGTVQGWANSGIAAANTASVLVEDINASENAVAGIRVGQNSVVQSCTSRSNGTAANGFGISAGSGSVISKCTVTNTTGAGSSPLRGDTTTLVIDCVARGNSGTGGNVIEVGTAGSVVRCVVSNNTNAAAGIGTGNDAKVTDCVVRANGGVDNDGIAVGAGSEVRNCTASSNSGAGILASDLCLLVGNHCVSNTSGAGINVTGSGNRIEANDLKNCSFGLLAAPGTGNLIIRNSAGGNTGGDYVIGSNNAAGPIVTRNNVATNTNPHANFDTDTP